MELVAANYTAELSLGLHSRLIVFMAVAACWQSGRKTDCMLMFVMGVCSISLSMCNFCLDCKCQQYGCVCLTGCLMAVSILDAAMSCEWCLMQVVCNCIWPVCNPMHIKRSSPEQLWPFADSSDDERPLPDLIDEEEAYPGLLLHS